MTDDRPFSRRTFLQTGSATFAGVAFASAQASAQTTHPAPAVPADTGAVQGGKVMFPNWRGSGDRAPPPPPAPMPPHQRVGFAIVGLGRLTLEEILPAFGETKRARVVALVSGTPAKAKLVAEQYGIAADAVYGYDEWERLARDPAIQAVYVVTPNAVHRGDVLAAAKAGKHVLCEKPMAASSAEARDMIAACAAAKVKLMIAYRCQYEPYNREVVRLARTAQFGKPRLIQAFNGQTTGLPEQWRLKKALAGGGALPDIGLYCLNGVRALLGEEPVSVEAQIHSPTGDPKFGEVEETVSFTLRFPSQVIAQCMTSYGVHESRRLQLHTERADIDLQNAFAYRGQRLVVSRPDGQVESQETRILTQKNQFALEIDHMARCILEDRRPRTPGEEGLQDHVLMEAIYEAARTGRPVTVGPPTGGAGGLDVTRGPELDETD